MKKDWGKRITLGITGGTEEEWREKIDEINEMGLDTASLFLERYRRNQRKMIYAALEESSIKNIPLIHIKNEMTRDELDYLCRRYDNPLLTIHENSFEIMDKWHGFFGQLYLEMNYDNHVAQNIIVERIGGFCVDLAHFKAAEEKWSREFEYTLKRKDDETLFACNHLSGYSHEKNQDVHIATSLSQFDYLITLPDFVLSDVIAIEVDNPLSEQIEFRKYILDLLNSR